MISMYTVLIADDESIIRRGLKKVLDWESLGYSIIGEATNGKEALSFILKNNPDIVLLDIKMPGMDGLSVIKCARENRYKGKIIILSGYSDFKYAQEAIRYDVKFYLTKPIDDESLESSLKSISEQIKEESLSSLTINHYLEKAKSNILKDLVFGTGDISKINLNDIHFNANIYQIVIYEKYSHNIADISYDFSELLKVTNQEYNSYDSVTIGDNEIVILKGNFAINKFNQFVERFNRDIKPQKGSPLDSLFLSYGRIVYVLKDLPLSYDDAYKLLQRRFFCEIDQHTIGYELLPIQNDTSILISNDLSTEFCTILVNYIQAFNRNKVAEALHSLRNKLYYSKDNIDTIKLFLTDLLIQIKDKLNHLYTIKNITFPTNAQIIDFIRTKHYLHEIFLFFTEQFEIIMNSIGNSSRDTVINDILFYIQHNYKENIKLENIASLFGYNSSYLGKIFTQKMSESFNSYVDKVRIEHSKKLLEEENLKIYQVAENVGYQNVDYFYMKFKKYTGISPKEYRKKIT